MNDTKKLTRIWKKRRCAVGIIPTRKYIGITVTKLMIAIQGTSMIAVAKENGIASYMYELRSRNATARSRTRTGMTLFMQIIPVKIVVMNTHATIDCTPASSVIFKSR